MTESQREDNSSNCDYLPQERIKNLSLNLSSEEKERIRNLSYEELSEEILQENNRLHKIDPVKTSAGLLSSPIYDALLLEQISRIEKKEEQEEPIMSEDEILEFRFKLLDEIRRRRTPPPANQPSSTTTEHMHEGCTQHGKEPGING